MHDHVELVVHEVKLCAGAQRGIDVKRGVVEVKGRVIRDAVSFAQVICLDAPIDVVTDHLVADRYR